MKHFIGNIRNKQDIYKINIWLSELYGDNFRIDFLNEYDRIIKLPNTFGIVLNGHAYLHSEHGSVGRIDENDLVMLTNGTYTVDSENLKFFMMHGNEVTQKNSIVNFNEVLKEQGDAGGTRKTLKLDGQTRGDVHYIWVDENNVKIPHYHKRLTEIYVVQSGTGQMFLTPYENEKRIQELSEPIETGMIIAIPPYTIHNTTGNLTSHVIGLPNFYQDDMIFL